MVKIEDIAAEIFVSIDLLQKIKSCEKSKKNSTRSFRLKGVIFPTQLNSPSRFYVNC